MDAIDFMFADNNEIVTDALVSKIRAQGEDLEDLQDTVDKLARSVREVQAINEKLKSELAAAKKAAKAPKAPKAPDLPIVKSVKMIRGDLPKVTKKAASAPEKRRPGRPKKVAK